MFEGKLIVFEGLDGSGKDTQILELEKTLKSEHPELDVVTVSNVTDGPIGKTIRLLLSCEQGLTSNPQAACIYLAELFTVAEQIKVMLEEGKTVICSRWFYSTLAYAGKELTLYQNILSMASLLPVIPDVVVYVDLHPKDAEARVIGRGNKKEFYETMDKQIEIYDRYKNVTDYIKYAKELGTGKTDLVHANGNQNIDKVAVEIYEGVRFKLSNEN